MGRVRSLKKRRFAEEQDNGGLDEENLEDDSIVDPGAIKLLQQRRMRQKVGGSCTHVYMFFCFESTVVF
jgi:hypothetical protein